MSITIATHNGSYHADDICAVAALTLYLGEDTEVSVVRTRTTSIIEAADYVVDVGEINDGVKYFDHHQEEGAGERENGIPYAAFGLVWKTFGAHICRSSEVAEEVDKRFVQPIDAGDNGVSVYEPLFENIGPYKIQDLFHSFAPTWKEGDEKIDEVFRYCVDLALVVIKREIQKAKDKKEAEEHVVAAYEQAEDKRCIILSDHYPWKDMLPTYPEPLVVVYPTHDGSEGAERWRVQTVQKNSATFERRLLFPEEWAGKRGDELGKVAGVEGAYFCHKGRYLAVFDSKDTALEVAKKILP